MLPDNVRKNQEKVKERIKKVNEKTKEDLEAIKNGLKFSWVKIAISFFQIIMFIGTYAYGVYTAFVIYILRRVLEENNSEIIIALLNSTSIIILVGGWAISTICIVLNLQKSISNAIKNMEIKANLSANLQKQLITDTAATVKALVKKEGE